MNILFFTLAVSCGSGIKQNSDDSDVINTISIANAGIDQNVETTSLVILDGSASYDLDNDLITYQWFIVSKPNLSAVQLTDPRGVQANFFADQDGQYTVGLIVNDGASDSIADLVTIVSNSNNSRPTANAGKDLNVVTGLEVNLNGSLSKDADEDLISYSWDWQSKPLNSNSVLINNQTVNPKFTPDNDGQYVLSLIVNDGNISSDIDTIVIQSNTANSHPEAHAGKDQYVEIDMVVYLDGSESKDANGDNLIYRWNLVSKPLISNVEIKDLNSVNPKFTPDIEGSYVIGLVVSDSFFDSLQDQVTIVANSTNSQPVAYAGLDQNVETHISVELDGSDSTDTNGDNISYRWFFVSKPPASNATILNSTTVNPKFTPDIDGSYVIGLVVNDSKLDSQQDLLTIISNTSNSAPVASAGVDDNVETLTLVTLDGSESKDANGDNFTFYWEFVSIPPDSTTVLINPTQVDPTFTPDLDGSYVIGLVVNDSQEDSQQDRVTITSSTTNSAPVASAGVDDNVETLTLVTLDGSESKDANGDNFTFYWEFVSIPPDSTAVLINPTQVDPTFTPDLDGSYVIGLVVNDSQEDSQEDRVIITSSTTNIAPVASAGIDDNVETNTEVSLDGSASNDANGDDLFYTWSFESYPPESNPAFDDPTLESPKFTPTVDGDYVLNLIVNDSELDSTQDTVVITASTSINPNIDSFDGNGPLIGYTTNNESSLPDIQRVNGRYYANLTDNTYNITLHFNDMQGRIDAKMMSFPFEVIARNIGIGTYSENKDQSQIAPVPSGNNSIIFAGLQVHVENFDSVNSSHIVIGHRGGTTYTVEGKNTLNGSSSVTDEGAYMAPDGRADIRIVGNEDRTLTVYWQLPNLNQDTIADSWLLYGGNGNLPGQAPVYGASVYVGLISYAQGDTSVPFVGTCDSIEYID